MLILLALKTKAVIALAILAAGIGLGRVKNKAKIAAVEAAAKAIESKVLADAKAAGTVIVNEVKKL